jgi:hypothetical protein
MPANKYTSLSVTVLLNVVWSPTATWNSLIDASGAADYARPRKSSTSSRRAVA